MELGAFCEAKAPARAVNLSGVGEMKVSALHRAKDLPSRLVRGEVLTERERGQLDVLRAAMLGEFVLPADSPPPAPVDDTVDGIRAQSSSREE